MTHIHASEYQRVLAILRGAERTVQDTASSFSPETRGMVLTRMLLDRVLEELGVKVVSDAL